MPPLLLCLVATFRRSHGLLDIWMSRIKKILLCGIVIVNELFPIASYRALKLNRFVKTVNEVSIVRLWLVVLRRIHIR